MTIGGPCASRPMGKATKLHSESSILKTADDDLARYIRQACDEGECDAAQMIGVEDCFILLDKDDLREHLENASRDGEGKHTVYVSIRQGKNDGEIPLHASGHEHRLVVLRPKKSADMDRARLTHDTRRRLALAPPERAKQGRRRGILNLGLGVAILAMMSVTSLAILSPPYSYVVAAGALAPVGIMLARAAGKNA